MDSDIRFGLDLGGCSNVRAGVMGGCWEGSRGERRGVEGRGRGEGERGRGGLREECRGGSRSFVYCTLFRRGIAIAIAIAKAFYMIYIRVWDGNGDNNRHGNGNGNPIAPGPRASTPLPQTPPVSPRRCSFPTASGSESSRRLSARASNPHLRLRLRPRIRRHCDHRLATGLTAHPGAAAPVQVRALPSRGMQTPLAGTRCSCLEREYPAGNVQLSIPRPTSRVRVPAA